MLGPTNLFFDYFDEKTANDYIIVKVSIKNNFIKNNIKIGKPHSITLITKLHFKSWIYFPNRLHTLSVHI